MKQSVNQVVFNGLLVTMDLSLTVIENGAVAVSGDRIYAIGTTQEILAAFPAAIKVDAMGGIIMPGLINTHTHLPMVLLRGLAEDLPLGPWLQKVWQAENQFMSPENIALGAQLGIIELIMGGVTSAVDMYWFPDRTAEIAREIGFRLANGPVFLDSDNAPDQLTFEDRKFLTCDFLAEYRNDPLIFPMVMPHSTATDSPAMLVRVKDLANQYGIMLNMHCAETEAEAIDVAERYGKTPVELLNSIGLLDEHTLLAHCVHITPQEIEILSQSNTHVSHNPVSNLKLASGIAPIAQMVQQGVNVSIGTDGAQSSNDLDLWWPIRLTALLQKEHARDASLMKAPEVIKMATINAAKGMGLGDQIGSLEPGKRADLIILRQNSPHLTPLYDVYAQLVYTLGRDDVNSVMINGQWIMRDRIFIKLDIERIMGQVNTLAKTIMHHI